MATATFTIIPVKVISTVQLHNHQLPQCEFIHHIPLYLRFESSYEISP
jgi:hypothetical protein